MRGNIDSKQSNSVVLYSSFTLTITGLSDQLPPPPLASSGLRDGWCIICLLTVVEYLVVSLPVPLVLLLLVRHAAGEEDLVSVVTLSAGRVLLNFLQ